MNHKRGTYYEMEQLEKRIEVLEKEVEELSQLKRHLDDILEKPKEQIKVRPPFYYDKKKGRI